MAHRRAPLEGEPSGFRVHVPLQGMHLIHGVRNSGQVPLPSWADVDLPPSEWVPPAASFEEDTGRQRELNRLLAKLTQLPTHPDEGFPTVQSVADSGLELGPEPNMASCSQSMSSHSPQNCWKTA